MKAMYNDTKNYIKVSLTLFKQLKRITGADYRNLPTARSEQAVQPLKYDNMPASRVPSYVITGFQTVIRQWAGQHADKIRYGVAWIVTTPPRICLTIKN